MDVKLEDWEISMIVDALGEFIQNRVEYAEESYIKEEDRKSANETAEEYSKLSLKLEGLL